MYTAGVHVVFFTRTLMALLLQPLFWVVVLSLMQFQTVTQD